MSLNEEAWAGSNAAQGESPARRRSDDWQCFALRAFLAQRQQMRASPFSFERWNLLPGSVYDGDTLRVVRGNEELKVRFCGIDAPEKKQPMGVESRDYLRNLIDLGNGELLLVPIEKDRYGRTVAEVYVQDRKDSAINLNLEMVRSGYAWHYGQYSSSCPIRDELIMAEGMAKQEKVGIWNGNPQAPWEWRSRNK